MIFSIISVAIYISNIILSIIISLTIINKLYISKKFSKENDFHFYNDLFSWEMFFFQIAIVNIIQIFSILILNSEISNVLMKIGLYILFFLFWGKIIHNEKIMNKITYERHYYGGMISLIIVIILVILWVDAWVILIVLFITTLIPYFLVTIFLKNKHRSTKQNIEVILGSVFITIGCLITPELIEIFINYSLSVDFIIMLSPVLIILGTILIYESFRTDI